MTDVYISYAREDRESVRRLSEMLRFEGWDVWMDPTEPLSTNTAALDMKLGSAGAILVVWSGYSRGSEHVRSEAATGLYKNKLIQMRIDSAAPPRPFDQVEVIDMGRWSGERDDPNWRRVVSAVRLYAGVPGIARPQVTRRAAPPPRQAPAPTYLEPKRSVAWAPLIAVGVLVLGGAGVWLADPFGWRTEGGEIAENAEAMPSAPLEAAAVVQPAAGPIEDTAESASDWTRVNRDDSTALRDFISDYPRSSNAETARSLLRVRDAQAWVKAVTSDNDNAYQAYLKEFPANGTMPGAMAAAATDRLTSLSAERAQAIRDIQSGLSAMSLYDGVIDGQGGDETVRAAKQFASTTRKSAPQLSTAAPRDLRAFADAIQKAAGTKIAKAPIIATATTTTSAAAEADRQRIVQAQAAAQVATQSAAVVKPVAAGAADSLAAGLKDANDWAEAARAGTAAAYQSYLTAHPTGAQAAVARSALAKLNNKPAAFSLDQISGEVKTAAEAARRAQISANTRAASARDTAMAAVNAPGARSIVAANGDQYEAQISGGAPNGLGVKISGSTANSGDRYRGEMRDGVSSGLGVYEFGANVNNTGGATRYEGEHVRGGASGYGVTYWRNGDSFAGQETSASGQARGVFTFANGQKYEGELRDGTRNGFGVVWSPDGTLLAAGRWANGDLVEPITSGQ